MNWDNLANAAAALSLGLSLWLVISQRWERRRAFIELRMEVYSYPSKDRPHGRETRLVLMNHGPAVARRVSATLYTRDGESRGDESFFVGPKVLPIPIVWPGQDVHLPVITQWGMDISHAEVTWTDARRRPQTADTYLTDRHV